MAKKQLAKAALDRIKRSAKNGYPKGKKGSKPVKKGEKSYKKKTVNFDKFKQPAPKANRFGVTDKERKAAKINFGMGAVTGTVATAAGLKGAGFKKTKSKEPTKKMASEAYKKQKEKQKKYREKKGK